MHFSFLGVSGEKFTDEEEAAWKRILAEIKPGLTPLKHCKKVCKPGSCDLLPCPIGRYGKGPVV